MTDLISEIAAKLKQFGIEDSRYEARLILAHVLEMDEDELYFNCPMPNVAQQHQLEEIVSRRTEHYPLCKLLKRKGFYKYDFYVDEDVLSPRPDTEILVEAAIKYAKENQARKILDLGTGSGCIILSVMGDVEALQGVALDASKKALDIAQKNAQKLGLEQKIAWIEGSWFDDKIAEKLGQNFDIIVSNPPYIPSSEISDLSPEVREHDPKMALDGGKDGLEHYRQIAKLAEKIISPQGKIFLEGGAGQAEDIAEIFEKQGFSKEEILQDYGGINRCIILKK